MKKIKALISGGAAFVGHHIILNLLRETNYDIVSGNR